MADTSKQIRAFDADGHFLERIEDILPYIEAPWRDQAELWPGDQPWVINPPQPRPYDYGFGLTPAEQLDIWHRVLDDHDIEGAALFSSLGAASVCTIQAPDFAVAAARACNTHFATDYASDRLKPMGVLPMRDPQAAAAELRRAAGLGIIGFEVMPIGLPFGLGDPFYDPIYRAAEDLDVTICVHGTRLASHEFGASILRNFSEVHTYAFPAGVILHFTSVMTQGLPLRFPSLRMAFLEIGCTWLPYYLDRLDEHYEKRGPTDMPMLSDRPSDMFRGSRIKVSLEAIESLLPQTVEYVGAGHLVYATDLPHWDTEFPANLREVRETGALSPAVKERILYSNAKELFRT